MKMIKLYDKFKHWNEKGVIWVYSDPHFNDEDCKLMNKNWPTPKEQIKLINKCVSKNDTLIILGDVGDENYVKYLKGYKVLIKGNHDKGTSNYKKKYFLVSKDSNPTIPLFSYNSNDFEILLNDLEYLKKDNPEKEYYIRNNGLFDEIYEGPLFINKNILLSHEPIKLNFGINIHGHEHNQPKSISRVQEWAAINVCADNIDFTPQRLDKLIEEFDVKDIHRVTIDKAVGK